MTSRLNTLRTRLAVLLLVAAASSQLATPAHALIPTAAPAPVVASAPKAAPAPAAAETDHDHSHLPPAAPTAAPEAPAAPVDTKAQEALKAADAARVAELQRVVDEVNARAEEVNRRLTAATQAYESGVADYERKKAESDAAAAHATEAEVEAEAAKETLGDYARATYMGSPIKESPLLYVMMSDSPADALQGAGYLGRIGDEKNADLSTAVESLEQAEKDRKEAERLQKEADAQKAQLQTELDAVTAEAEKASAELTTKVEELDLARMQAETSAKTSNAGNCSAEMPGTYPVVQRWGGFSNGLIPLSALCPIRDDQQLRWDAAAAFREMDKAYAAHFGTSICVTDSYRSYEAQVSVYARKPGLAAVPGTSNHGWSLATDLCGGIQTFGTAQHEWMKANAAQFGWFHPGWAQQGGSKPEAWHWEYGKIS